MRYSVPKFLSILFVLVLCGTDSFTQSTFESYTDTGAGEKCIDFKSYFNDGYIITGVTGVNDALLISKLDSQGDTIWTKLYEVPFISAVGLGIAISQDSGFGVVGTYNHQTLLKFDQYGDTLWTKNHLLGYYHDIESVSDGGFVIVGCTYPGSVTQDSDILIVRTDAVGDLVWSTEIPLPNGNTLNDVKRVSDGNYIAVGHANMYSGIDSPTSDPDGYIVKFTPIGDTLWTLNIPNSDGGHWLTGVEEDEFGDYIVSGSVLDHTPALKYICSLTKVSPAGVHIYTKRYDYATVGGQANGFSSVAVTCENDYVLGGQINSNDAILMKVNSNGDSLWLRELPATRCNALNISDDGAYEAAGYFVDSTNFLDTYMARYDTAGLLVGNGILDPNFTYVLGGSSIQFYANQSNAANYIWNFGDGTTSDLENPTHIYGTDGMFNVTLGVSNGCDTVWSEIQMIQSYAKLIETKSDLLLFQVNNILHLTTALTPNSMVKIYDMRGKGIFNGTNVVSPINLQKFHAGTYVVQIYNPENGFLTKKIILD
jgi:hypothetical protein